MTRWKEVKDNRMKYEKSNPQTYAWTEAGWDSDKYRKGWDEIFGNKARDGAGDDEKDAERETPIAGDNDGGESGE